MLGEGLKTLIYIAFRDTDFDSGRADFPIKKEIGDPGLFWGIDKGHNIGVSHILSCPGPDLGKELFLCWSGKPIQAQRWRWLRCDRG